MRDGGARLLLGTNAGVPFLIPGFSAHRELVSLVQAGLMPYEALARGCATQRKSSFGTLDSTVLS